MTMFLSWSWGLYWRRPPSPDKVCTCTSVRLGKKQTLGRKQGSNALLKCTNIWFCMVFDVEFGTKIYFPASQIIFLCFSIFSISPWETGEIWGNSDNFFFDFFHRVPVSCTYANGYSLESLECVLSDGIFHVMRTVTWQMVQPREDSTPDLRHQKLSRNSWTTPNGHTGVSPPENTQSKRHFLLTDHRMHDASSRSKKSKRVWLKCRSVAPIALIRQRIWTIDRYTLQGRGTLG